MQTRQENTTQGNRAVSPIRKGEQPLGTEQCSHPQDKQIVSIAMEDDTSLTNQQSETIDLRSIDTQQTSEGNVIALDPTNTEKQTWAMMTSMELTESPDNRTTGETETKGKPITDM